jgi:hypothetical protein
LSDAAGTARQLFALAVAAFALEACGPAPPPKPLIPLASPLHLAPLTDLAPAASLVWLLDAHPRTIALDGRLAATLAPLFSDKRLDAFAHASGGVDLRETDTLVVATYPSSALLLAHQFVQPARVEAAFRARAVKIEGRALDGSPDDPRTAILRLWGATGTEREQIAVFGLEAVGIERGRFGPLRAAELFAEGKLKRASPALHAAPLSRLAELLGDGPLRAFAPGPFEGELRGAAGGLLGACTAVGAAAHVVDRPPGEGAGIAVHAVFLGAWGAEAEAAADRLRAVFDVTAASGAGRLLGLARCLTGPTVRGTADALTLDFTLDAATFGEGLHAATGAEVSEIMDP